MSDQAAFDTVAEPAGLDQVVQFIAAGIVHSVKREPTNRGVLGRSENAFELGDFVVRPGVAINKVSQPGELRCRDAAVCTSVRCLAPPFLEQFWSEGEG